MKLMFEGKRKNTCSICGCEFDGYGNNPYPYAEDGVCCDQCNMKYVIPARIKKMKNESKLNEALSSEFGSISDGDYCATVVVKRSGSWRAYPGKVVGNKIYTSALDERNDTWIRKEIAICPLSPNMVSDKDKELIEMNIASSSRKVSDEARNVYYGIKN